MLPVAKAIADACHQLTTERMQFLYGEWDTGAEPCDRMSHFLRSFFSYEQCFGTQTQLSGYPGLVMLNEASTVVVDYHKRIPDDQVPHSDDSRHLFDMVKKRLIQLGLGSDADVNTLASLASDSTGWLLGTSTPRPREARGGDAMACVMPPKVVWSVDENRFNLETSTGVDDVLPMWSSAFDGCAHVRSNSN